MLQTASFPQPVSLWGTPNYPFYFEVFGETRPLIDVKYSEVLPAGSVEEMPKNVTSVPIYQYWWTIGHSEDFVLAETFPYLVSQSLEESALAATVSLYFPSSGGWRIKELLPTVRYLKPVHEQIHMWQKVGEVWSSIAPLLAGAATLPLKMDPLTAIPMALLPSIAKLHVNTVPPVEGYEWSVDKISRQLNYGLMQGVRWNIPKKMFRELAGRLTGSLALSFIPSQPQYTKEDVEKPPVYLPRPILAQTVLHTSPDPQKHWYLPAYNEFVKLFIEPFPDDIIPPAHSSAQP